MPLRLTSRDPLPSGTRLNPIAAGGLPEIVEDGVPRACLASDCAAHEGSLADLPGEPCTALLLAATVRGPARAVFTIKAMAGPFVDPYDSPMW
jgi:hypothetical protein